MCLILFGYKCHPRYKLIVAANRDEFLDRPTASLGMHYPGEQIYCGRDLRAGGTWLAVSAGGKLAAVTNYRDPNIVKSDAPSRGDIVLDYLRSQVHALQYLESFRERSSCYNGCNVLAMDRDKLCYHCTVDGRVQELGEGVYGLSNRFLDSDWPKVSRGKELFTRALDGNDITEKLFKVLTDRQQPPLAALPETGVGPDWEKLLAPIHIQGQTYGTRSSSVVLISYSGEVRFTEQSWEYNPQIRRGTRKEIAFSFS